MTVLSSPVGLRSFLNSLVAFSIIVSSVAFLFHQGQKGQVPLAIEHEHQEMQVQVAAENHQQMRPKEAQVTAELPDASMEECNWSTGRWVYDNVSRPLYSGLECAFIFPELSCDKYGRKDVKYQHWRWQPHGCDLPRYDYNTDRFPNYSCIGSISSSVLFLSLPCQQIQCHWAA